MQVPSKRQRSEAKGAKVSTLLVTGNSVETMPHFRPLPVFAFVCTLMFAALISLGVWQVQRLHWKLGLIAEVNRSLALPPVSS